MNFNTEVVVDLDDVKRFIENRDFHRYLLENAPNFETAAFVLQTLLNAVEVAAQQVDNTENI